MACLGLRGGFHGPALSCLFPTCTHSSLYLIRDVTLITSPVMVIKDASLEFECLRIEASIVTQPRVVIVSQGSGSENSSQLEFHSS